MRVIEESQRDRLDYGRGGRVAGVRTVWEMALHMWLEGGAALGDSSSLKILGGGCAGVGLG